MRTLISGDSPYDRFTQGEHTALTTAQQRGMDLFFSERLACGSCHSGFNFSNETFVNNGLYLDYGADPGRQRVTIDSADIGAFRVPTLRNVALTAPYMHDGSLADLEAVIAHYNQGGQGNPLQDERIRPLGLSASEQSDLIAFLEALTDTAFVHNPAFRQ
jgi:cytochrome c peroxidase